MNKIILTGRITKEFELRYTREGKAFTSFNLAVDKNLSKDKKQELEASGKATADFPRVIVWGSQAENLAKYMKKGSKILVEGRIQTGRYQASSGDTVYTTDVLAEHVEFLESANSNNKNNNINQNNNSIGDDFFDVEDDSIIPF